ncbi:MAG TPA: GNAT family protein [Rhabdochlamydiaceae bacterium]|nr:GNAT family protein [Rhabdochlamydiaceae bacterium]
MGSITNLPGYDIRYTNLMDAAYLRDWLNSPGMLQWFPMSTEKELEDAMRVWIGFSRFNSSITATFNSVPCGIGTLFLMPYRKVAHHCIFKIIVDPKFQRRGIGSSILKNLMHLAKNYFHLELMHIEVFEGNPMILMLQKFHFREFARQQNFVKEEDGKYLGRVLMECDL